MEYFCTACNCYQIADPRYYINEEHLCQIHFIEFYGTKKGTEQ